MKNARFWTGLLFCTGLPMSLVIGTSADFTQHSLVEGSVTYNGRPVTEGLVMFQSLDRKRSPDIIALVDRSGRFEGRAEWTLDPAGRTQFRIYVFPDPRDVREAQLAEKEGRKPPVKVIATVPSDFPPPRDLTGTAKAALVSRGGPPPACVAGPPAPAVKAPESKPSRWLPEIWLAPEPTRVDIDLKD